MVWIGAEIVEDYQSRILKVRTERVRNNKTVNTPYDNDLHLLQNLAF